MIIESCFTTICSTLKIQDLLSMSYVCKCWNKLLKEEKIWEQLLQKDTSLLLEYLGKDSYKILSNWKKLKYVKTELKHSKPYFSDRFYGSNNPELQASLSEDGILSVYKRTQLYLTINNLYPAKVSGYEDSFYIFHSWVIVSRDGILKVIDILKNSLLATLVHTSPRVKIFTDGKKLFIQKLMNHAFQEINKTISYDFSKTDKPSSPKYCSLL